jgi:hypothetical protein
VLHHVRFRGKSGRSLAPLQNLNALLCQHGPGDPRQLVGESRGQNVRMQALSGAREPDPEAVGHQDTVPGIGPIISSAMVAAIGSGAAFAKGRDFSAWIGLVPKQMSTGDRTMLGRACSSSKQPGSFCRGRQAGRSTASLSGHNGHGGAAASQTRTRMTQSGHSLSRSSAAQSAI